MHYLLLIRRPQPEIVADIPAREWQLSVEGRRRCENIIPTVATYAPVKIVTSREPKAIETGHIIAERLRMPVYAADNLHEHERSKVPLLSRDEFTTTVKRFFDHPNQLVLGDETADQAHIRFDTAIQNLLSHHPAETLTVVAHGTVISLFVSRHAGVDAFRLWEQLGMPALLVLSRPEMKLIGNLEGVTV